MSDIVSPEAQPYQQAAEHYKEKWIEADKAPDLLRRQMEELSRQLSDAKSVLRSADSLLSVGEVEQARQEISFYVTSVP